MVGQVKLIEKFKSFSIDTFPRSILLIGDKGMGKHTFANMIASEMIKFTMIDLTENISSETIDNIYRSANPAVYLIDLSAITEKSQNTILKFVEEPLKNSFIILLAEAKNSVLNTILNRCQVFEFDPYSKEELKTFVAQGEDSEAILQYLSSPGQILTTSLKNINEMRDVCGKIVTRLSQANYANTLSIGGKINFKDEYDKFDLIIFLKILEAELLSHWISENSIRLYRMYSLTREHRERLRDSRLNKEQFFNHYITELWRLCRS